MQIQIPTQHLIRSGLALALALTLGSLFAPRAAESEVGEKISESKMMQHMMQHMEMGKESMSKCPMMKDKHDKKTGAHEKHHEEAK